jgi:hypothetical protein
MGGNCQVAGALLSPDPAAGNGVPLTQVPAGGPNELLWYVSSFSLGLHLTSQVLRDYRSDADTLRVQTGDSVAAGCLANNMLPFSPIGRTLTQVNVNCMQNTGAFMYDSLVTFAWAHEDCHGKRSKYKWQFVENVDSSSQRMVDTTENGLRFRINDKLSAANDSVKAFSGAIDITGPPFSMWSRDTANTLWYRKQFLAKGVLPPIGVVSCP